jgi:hypothetical protein
MFLLYSLLHICCILFGIAAPHSFCIACPYCISVLRVFIAYLYCISVLYICITFARCISVLRICTAYLYCMCLAYLHCIFLMHMVNAYLHCILYSLSAAYCCITASHSFYLIPYL